LYFHSSSLLRLAHHQARYAVVKELAAGWARGRGRPCLPVSALSAERCA